MLFPPDKNGRVRANLNRKKIALEWGHGGGTPQGGVRESFSFANAISGKVTMVQDCEVQFSAFEYRIETRTGGVRCKRISFRLSRSSRRSRPVKGPVADSQKFNWAEHRKEQEEYRRRVAERMDEQKTASADRWEKQAVANEGISRDYRNITRLLIAIITILLGILIPVGIATIRAGGIP